MDVDVQSPENLFSGKIYTQETVKKVQKYMILLEINGLKNNIIKQFLINNDLTDSGIPINNFLMTTQFFDK